MSNEPRAFKLNAENGRLKARVEYLETTVLSEVNKLKAQVADLKEQLASENKEVVKIQNRMYMARQLVHELVDMVMADRDR